MADHLKQALGIGSELIPGGRGVFIVSVDGGVVARKTLDGFPTPEECEAAVRAALQARPPSPQ